MNLGIINKLFHFFQLEHKYPSYHIEQYRGNITIFFCRDKLNAEKEALRIQMEKENAEIQSRLEKENALLREQLDASKSGLQVMRGELSFYLIAAI